ncbi:MAG: RDD family protein [Rickettsiaceae bacterium]|nr:RDD family protein [Rickettsiaceae bacterium]MDP5082942.1 RDD family protein [Rickettsiaceae bacterium]
MQKQIIYPKFIPRVFAMTIDIVILSLVLAPVMDFLSRHMFIYVFNDFFILNAVDTANNDAVVLAVKSPEFTNYVTAARFFTYSGSLFLLNTIFMGAYFVILWRKFGTTPGKMAMRMKIVDADDYSRPSVYNLIKRFCGYITAFIGIWSIVFSKRGIALHDKLANTVVIKS